MYDVFVRKRITELREKMKVSEYQMSVDLGRSKGYVQSISAGRALPSLAEFFNICEYFNITPKEFFDDEIEPQPLVNEILHNVDAITDQDKEIVLSVAKRFREYSEKE